MLGVKLTDIISESEIKTSHLKALIDRFSQSLPFRKLNDALFDPARPRINIAGLAGSSKAILFSILTDHFDNSIIAVTSDPDEAADLFDDLNFILGEKQVAHFPPRQVPPYEFRTPSAEIIGQRLSTLSRLINHDVRIVVASVDALIEPTISRSDFDNSSLIIKIGQETEIESLAEKLSGLGFQRVPQVEEVGDFALRGGLIDFFSPGFDSPVRVEFLGDTVETIRAFEVPTQRTMGRLEEVILLPRREIPITQKTLEPYLEKLTEKDADFIRARYLNDPELPGLEWLAVSFGLDCGSLLDYLENGSTIFISDSSSSFNFAIEEIKKSAQRHRERISDRLMNLPSLDDYFRNGEKLLSNIDSYRRLEIIPFAGGRKDIIDFQCRDHPAVGSRLDLLSNIMNSFHNEHIRFFIATDNPGQAQRLGELLSEKIPQAGPIPIEVALLKGGFVSRENRMALLTDHQIFGKYFRRTRRKKFKEGVALQNYTSLVSGDYVVHEDFGIARYVGLKTITIDGRERDCLYLVYAEGGKLYVPIEEFNRVSKYAGKDSAPKLSVLGGTGWEKIKARTKKAIADMAADLIKIYAERKTRPGFSFGPDTTWMKQLEASFIYEETPDQLKAIEDIKSDMEKATPMDRLVCGDVGYGKTEVAVRAAFKAVESGKQVAVLVPTTILAQQHLNTFTSTVGDFPVKIEMLSRFRTRNEQKEIVEQVADGKCGYRHRHPSPVVQRCPIRRPGVFWSSMRNSGSASNIKKNCGNSRTPWIRSP